MTRELGVHRRGVPKAARRCVWAATSMNETARAFDDDAGEEFLLRVRLGNLTDDAAVFLASQVRSGTGDVDQWRLGAPAAARRHPTLVVTIMDALLFTPGGSLMPASIFRGTLAIRVLRFE